MTDRVTVVLVGMGGYGEVYLSALLDESYGTRCRLVGAVDPQPHTCSRLTELHSRSVPVHPTLRHFYRGSSADFAIISSPIHLHAEHTCVALTHGSHVLVEKPAAAVTRDVDCMIEARDRIGFTVAVGFQWSFAHSILQLKRDILAGRFGAPISARCLTLWPRTEDYYRRNDWAGKRRDPQGRWILDSPANNAMAHFLHNMLFLLGNRVDRSASPASIAAHLARANDIETFDTIGAHVIVNEKVGLLFLASHAIGEAETMESRFKLEFEDAVVSFPGGSAPIAARFSDGTMLEYESPNATPQSEKLWHCIEGISGTSDIPCGLETARAHTQCIEEIEESGTAVFEFKEDSVRRDETGAGLLRWVPGLAAALERAYEDNVLPDLRGVK
jgi:predicted dehydrogenase